MTRSESTGITPGTRLARCVAATGRRREPLRTARIACRVAALRSAQRQLAALGVRPEVRAAQSH